MGSVQYFIVDEAGKIVNAVLTSKNRDELNATLRPGQRALLESECSATQLEQYEYWSVRP